MPIFDIEIATRHGEAVAHLTDRPVEDVHFLAQPEARGRIAFGGKVVK